MTKARTTASRWAPTLFALVAQWMALIFYLSSRQAPPQAANTVGGVIPLGDLAHLAEYGVLSLLLALALQAAGWPRSPSWPGARLGTQATLAVLLTVLYGASDELHQAFVPSRSSELSDVGLDAVGGAAGAALWALLAWLVLRWRRRNAREAGPRDER